MMRLFLLFIRYGTTRYDLCRQEAAQNNPQPYPAENPQSLTIEETFVEALRSVRLS